MKKGYCTRSFSEKESLCENSFIENGPYWHLYTDGTQMQDIFCTEEETDIGMWILATAACSVKDAFMVTFEIMANHIHLIMSGRKDSCLKLFEIFKSRLRRVMKLSGRIIDWSQFDASIIPIESLRSLRNEIIYTNRNAYVANPNHTPDSYQWGGGCVFFNGWLEQLPIKDITSLSFDKIRGLTHSRDISAYKGLRLVGQRVFIPSFCRTDIGESFFTDARSYFNCLTKNAEIFSEIAKRLKDSIFLTDDELYAVAISYIRNEFNERQTSGLSPQQRIDTARHLKNKYNVTKQQLRRILRLEERILTELFP